MAYYRRIHFDPVKGPLKGATKKMGISDSDG
jgi:hypothetical protein